MAKFKVGEIAIMNPIESQTPLEKSHLLSLKGEECEVVSEPQLLVNDFHKTGVMVYDVRCLKDGTGYFCMENELKKKGIPPDVDEWAKDRVRELLVPNPDLLVISQEETVDALP